MKKRMSLAAMMLCAWCATPVLASDWIVFSNQTQSRISAASNLVTLDAQEKDYAYGDVDNDGDIDLVIVRKQPFTSAGKMVNVLLMNENGVLVDRTQEYATAADDGGQGFKTPTNDRDVILVDVNNDGWLDMVTATTLTDNQAKTLSHPRVYMNLGNDGQGNWLGFKYEEARIPQMHATAGPRFCSVRAIDANDDGYMDLYFGDYDSGPGQILDYNNRLLMNKGAAQPGFYVDESTLRMTPTMLTSAFGASSVTADINNDGAMDIVKQTSLNNPLHIAVIYNDPANKGVFKSYHVIDTDAPYFVAGGDLNNDGWTDLVVVDDGTDKYYLNQANPNANGQVGWSKFNLANSGGFGGDAYLEDFNNDGWLDVIITDVDVDIPGCDRITNFYRNNGNAPNVTLSHDQANLTNSTLQGVHDVAIFDINGDGWKDIVFGRCSNTIVQMNIPPIGINFTYPVGFPGQIAPLQPASFQVNAAPDGGNVVPGTARLCVASSGGSFVETEMSHLGGNLFEATLPPSNCSDSLKWYLSVQLDTGDTFTSPANAPNSFFSTEVSFGQAVLIKDPIEIPADIAKWTVYSDASLTGGEWEAAEPVGSISGSGQQAAPNKDKSAPSHFVKAFVTENGVPGAPANAHDVDGGATYLVSPKLDLAGTDGFVTFSYWMFTEAGTPDFLVIQVTNDGSNWTQVASLGNSGSAWKDFSFRVGDFVTPTADVQVRFIASDYDASLTEAGIDEFLVTRFVCDLGIVDSFPPNNAIDARQPSNIDGTNPEGFLSFDVTFATPARFYVESDFEVTQQGGSGTLQVAAVQVLSEFDLRIFFNNRIEVGSWTTLTHTATGSNVRVGYLPGDVNGNGSTTVSDVLTLIDSLNGIGNLPIWSTDIDRSGTVNASDVLRLIDLLNGAGAFDTFNGATLPQ